jgi:phosphoglycolate phosphatase
MTNASHLDRAWDSFDAYLFDIDGTLLECTDATHYFAFCHVLKEISGRELTLDGVVAQGNTDVGILRDAWSLAGIPEETWRARLPEILDRMGSFVEQRRDELCVTALPGVRNVLEHLQAQGAKLGIATGNLERVGRLKLERAGLWNYFDFAGWSDAHEYRVDVFLAAINTAREFCGRKASLCVVGDTPTDIRAAQQNHLPIIAVSTGIYSFDQLMKEQPELCLHTFEELFATAV